MTTPMTALEYAGALVERYRSMRPAVGETNLRQIFLGAKRVVPNWLDSETKAEFEEAYRIAEEELFPNRPGEDLPDSLSYAADLEVLRKLLERRVVSLEDVLKLPPGSIKSICREP